MAYNIAIQEEAVVEIREAFDWYEEKRDGLGYEFLEELEVCYEKITFHPERYLFFNSFYRRIKLNRFPYLIIYEVTGDDIIINSIFHIKRNRI